MSRSRLLLFIWLGKVRKEREIKNVICGKGRDIGRLDRFYLRRGVTVQRVEEHLFFWDSSWNLEVLGTLTGAASGRMAPWFLTIVVPVTAVVEFYFPANLALKPESLLVCTRLFPIASNVICRFSSTVDFSVLIFLMSTHREECYAISLAKLQERNVWLQRCTLQRVLQSLILTRELLTPVQSYFWT